MKLFQAVVIAFALAMTTSLAFANDLPGLTKTTGKSRPGLTKKVICNIQWDKDERHVKAGPA